MRANPEMGTFWEWARADLPDDPSGARQYIVDFAKIAFLGWNLEDNGEPVPATPENFADRLDMPIARSLIRGLSAQIGRVDGPLARPSLNGSTSRARRASRSRPSSRKPSSSKA
jgi:hypothetical protein